MLWSGLTLRVGACRLSLVANRLPALVSVPPSCGVYLRSQRGRFVRKSSESGAGFGLWLIWGVLLTGSFVPPLFFASDPLRWIICFPSFLRLGGDLVPWWMAGSAGLRLIHIGLSVCQSAGSPLVLISAMVFGVAVCRITFFLSAARGLVSRNGCPTARSPVIGARNAGRTYPRVAKTTFRHCGYRNRLPLGETWAANTFGSPRAPLCAVGLHRDMRCHPPALHSWSELG